MHQQLPCQAGNATKMEESQARASDSPQSTAAMPGVLILNYRDDKMPTDQLPRCQMTTAPDPVTNASEYSLPARWTSPPVARVSYKGREPSIHCCY